MIPTVNEAYRAVYGREPDESTASSMTRILKAIGVTRERDPVAGLLVLLEAYYGAIRSKAYEVRHAKDVNQTRLNAVLKDVEELHTEIWQAKSQINTQLHTIQQNLTVIQNQLSNIDERLSKLEARPTSLLSRLFGCPHIQRQKSAPRSNGSRPSTPQANFTRWKA